MTTGNEDMKGMEGQMMSLMVMVIGLSVITQVLTGIQPAAPTYCCPLETDVCFSTYDELYSHFVSQHPTEDIEIIWE